jgi:hypothetical protein
MNCLYCSFRGQATAATRVWIQPHPAVGLEPAPDAADQHAKDLELWAKTHGRVYLCTEHADTLKNHPGTIVDANS